MLTNKRQLYAAVTYGEYLEDENGVERLHHLFDSHEEYWDFMLDFYDYYSRNLYVYGSSDSGQFRMDTKEIELYLNYLNYDAYNAYIAKQPKHLFGEYAADQAMTRG